MKSKDWLKEFKKGVWHINHKDLGIPRGCNCEMEDDCGEKLIAFISHLLKTQREELKKQYEKRSIKRIKKE